MEFIDLTSASEDERYQVKDILSNVSRNLEFTCGSKLVSKQTKSAGKERVGQNGRQVDQIKNNSKQTNYQSSAGSHQTISSPDQSIVNSSTSSNSSSNSLKMNGYHYNYYNHPNNLDGDGHMSNSNHQYNHPNHYSTNHYHNSHHPNVHSSRMQPPPVMPYSTHFIPHNGTLPPDHLTAQYHHKLPYYTPPHQFTPNTSSKPFYPTTGPHFTPNTVLTSIPSIVTSANGVVVTSNHQLHPHQNEIFSPQQATDLNTSNAQQQRTNALNDVHSPPYQVTYNPANGLPSNHHSFVHHPASYIPNAHHFAQPNVPMYFVPLPMTQFYPPTHYPHLANAQPAILTTAPPHQSLATPPISPQDQDNDETCSTHNCDDNRLENNEKDENVSNDVNDKNEKIDLEESGNDEDEKDDKYENTNKDLSAISSYSFLSPESIEEVNEFNDKNDGDKKELIEENNIKDESTDFVSTGNDDNHPLEESFSANESNATNYDQPQEEQSDSNSHKIDKLDSEVIVSNVESIGLTVDSSLNEDSKTNKDVNANNEANLVDENDEANEVTEDILPKVTTTNELKVAADESKPRSWADLFKSGKTDYSKTSQIIIMDDSANANNSLFDKTDFEPLGEQLDSIVKLREHNLQQQVIKSVPWQEDDLFPKLSRKLKDLNLKHSLPLLCPRGFTNSSNWCYINAILQALLYCPPFYNLMREIAETPGIFREKSATPIIDSFAKFFTNFMPNEQLMKRIKTTNFGYDDLPKLEAYEPKCIYNVLGNINNECLKGRQEDAEEFLSAVLNCLHEEILLLLDYDPKAIQSQHHQAHRQNVSKNSNSSNAVVTTSNNSPAAGLQSIAVGSSVACGGHQLNEEKLSNLDNAKQAWKAVKNRHKTFTSSNYKNADTQITDIFGGMMLFIRKAGSDINHSRQPFFTLKLDIQSEKTRTVEDALRNLTLSESIHGYICPKTNKAIDATCQTFLDQLPAILVLHLKLHNDDNGQTKKSMKKINFPIDLEMPKECLTQQDRSKYSKTYKLLAVVHHDGKDTAKGHYFTDIYHIGTNLWLRCDDSKIEQISVQQLMHPKDSKIPYLLFYRRCDTLRGSKNQN